MPQITIRVGASRDASLATVFQPLEQASKRAKTRLAADADASAKEVAQSAKRGARDEADAYRDALKEIAKLRGDKNKAANKADSDRAKAAAKAARDEAQAVAKSARDAQKTIDEKGRAEKRAEAESARTKAKARADELRDDERQYKALLRDAKEYSREEARLQKAEEKKHDAAKKNGFFGQPIIERGHFNAKTLAHTTASVLSQVGSTALSFGSRVASTGLAGAGVDTSPEAAIARNVQLEASATKISSSAYMPGHAGANGERQDPKKLMEDVRGVADATATDTNIAMDALDKFVAKTGDLATGRDMLMQLAVLSKATGADLSDMADASADVANTLGDVPDKGKATLDVMRLITAQGKEGAVEIKDLATQMAKVASAAGQFSGDRGKNIAEFGALTQFARQKGGASSATQAAQSTVSFMSQFGKGQRLDAFKSYGVDVHDKNGRTRDAEDIILESIKAAATKKGVKNVVQSMGDMVKDQQAQRVTRPFIDSFQTNYAKAQGTEEERISTAIAQTRAEFDALKASVMDDKQVADSFSASMKTTDSQAQLLNNRFSDAAAQLSGPLKAAITELAEAALPATKAVAAFVDKMFGSPGKSGLEADVEAGNAIRIGENAQRNGVVSPENPDGSGQISQDDFGRMQKARETEAKALADRLAEENSTSNVYRDKPSAYLQYDIDNHKSNADDAQQELNRRKSIDENKETLEKLDSLIAAIKNGNDPNQVLKVQIVGAAPVPPDPSGTSGGPGKPGFGAPK